MILIAIMVHLSKMMHRRQLESLQTRYQSIISKFINQINSYIHTYHLVHDVSFSSSSTYIKSYIEYLTKCTLYFHSIYRATQADIPSASTAAQ